MLVTLRQLQYVIAVAETGSFSKAADHCAAEQSTVSQQVKAMEDRLGVTLFDRSKQPITATAEGKKVVEQAREIIDKVEVLIKPFKRH
ncbi:MAG: LysR family transcriptional regulator [Bacteroidetes bacterium]|nr:LysR family transcriptional regulator [Bacteroidota bacterium]